MNDPIASILAARRRTHGNFTDHARIAQNLKLMMSSNGDFEQQKWLALTNEQRESLEMITHKIGRILAGDADFRDHWDDIAGYAQLAAEGCSK